MKAAVFSFIRPSPNSTIASVRIARFIARTLSIPLIADETVKQTRWDVLILVNGAFSFCPCRDDVAVAVRRAKRIIWVQNDYMIYAPIPDGQAESVFRKAFVQRRGRGLPDMDHWTTVKEKSRMTKQSRYINWNMLTALKRPMDLSRNHAGDLFYYGAFRERRERTFDAYFRPKKMPLTISSASKKFADRYPHATILGSIARDRFYDELHAHGLGLYIEDTRSHHEFHSPANRFYEMLSAGLPMVFEPDSYDMLHRAGFDIAEFVVERQRDARTLLRDRRAIARVQRKRWWTDFRVQLTDTLRSKFARYLTAISHDT